MLLDSIYANDTYLFRYKQAHYICRPYGVVTLKSIMQNPNINKTCKKALDDFVVHNPKLYYFSDYLLHIEEGYRVEFRGGACIIYAGSKKTLSEIFLQAGVAVERSDFDDEEFRYRFYQAVRAAKMAKRGIWSDAKLRNCMSELFKR